MVQQDQMGANVMKEVVRWAGEVVVNSEKGTRTASVTGEEGPRRSGVGRLWAESEYAREARCWSVLLSSIRRLALLHTDTARSASCV